ncbi:MAG TPA: hypothetical protein VGI16_14050 [Candidatus Acidoferrum sp.]|jgi:hypothetical protein
MKRIFSSSLVAILAGLGLRLFFVLKFPADSGDAVLYEEIATNWLKHHIYGMNLNGGIVPVDLRMPGYPAFLAFIYALTGKMAIAAHIWVMLAQVLVDLLGCVVIASLAALLVSQAQGADKARTARVFTAALWLAALCPFTANYTAVVMTEVFAIFLTGLTCVAFVPLVATLRDDSAAGFLRHGTTGGFAARRRADILSAFGGLFVGWATLFRPESPMLLLIAWVVLLAAAWKRTFLTGIRLCVISGIACALPLAPWALRNAITLHEVQILTPKYSNLPGELVPRGFMAWEKTWLFRMRDCYLVPWKLEEEAIRIEDIPARAFDSSEERSRVASILDEYNKTLHLTTEEDSQFAEIARERTARHPLRTYLWIPAIRALTIWFAPRIELVPLSGKVFPLQQSWKEDPVDQCFTVGFVLLNIFYVIAAGLGALKLWRCPAARSSLALLIAFLFVRTVFLTTLETPEPRYVLVCFPIVLALAAQIFVRRDPRQDPATNYPSSSGSG